MDKQTIKCLNKIDFKKIENKYDFRNSTCLMGYLYGQYDDIDFTEEELIKYLRDRYGENSVRQEIINKLNFYNCKQ